MSGGKEPHLVGGSRGVGELPLGRTPPGARHVLHTDTDRHIHVHRQPDTCTDTYTCTGHRQTHAQTHTCAQCTDTSTDESFSTYGKKTFFLQNAFMRTAIAKITKF